MKISCIRENLSKATSIVSKAISSKSTLPILNNFLLEAKNGSLKISATDLEIGINYWIGAKVEKEGIITIPARLFTEYLSNNTDEKINLELKNLTLNLKSDKYETNIKCNEANEYPLIPKIKKEPLFSLNCNLLKKGIESVIFATATDESRPILSGVLFQVKDKKLKLVATDSFRLAEKTIILEKKPLIEKSVIIPSKTLYELMKILSNFSNEIIDITITENQILFEINNEFQLISRLIEGNFPAYEQIIPQSFETRAKINREKFINIIKMANIFARENANNIKITISKGKIEVAASTAQLGDNISKIEAETEGDDNKIAFNARFLLEVLNIIETPEVFLELSGKLSPGVIKPVNQTDYIYIIMPLRV